MEMERQKLLEEKKRLEANLAQVLWEDGEEPSEGDPPARGASRTAAVEPNRAALSRAQPRWVPDAQAERCMLCNPTWRFRSLPGYRRHHCRSCGWVVCAACLPGGQTLQLDRWVTPQGLVQASDDGPSSEVRVCNSCAVHAPAEIAARAVAAADCEIEPQPESAGSPRASRCEPRGRGSDGQGSGSIVTIRECDADCIAGGCGQNTAVENGVLCSGCDLFLCHPCFGRCIVAQECVPMGRCNRLLSSSQAEFKPSLPGSLPCPMFPLSCSVGCIAHDDIQRALRHPLNRGIDGEHETADSPGHSPHKLFLLAQRQLAGADVAPPVLVRTQALAPLDELKGAVIEALDMGSTLQCPACGTRSMTSDAEVEMTCLCGMILCFLCGREKLKCGRGKTGCAEAGYYLHTMPGWECFAVEGEDARTGATFELTRRRQAFYVRVVMERTEPALWTALRKEHPTLLQNCPTVGRHIEWDTLASAEMPLFGSYLREANELRALCHARQRLAFVLCSHRHSIINDAVLPVDVMIVVCEALPQPSHAVATRAASVGTP